MHNIDIIIIIAYLVIMNVIGLKSSKVTNIKDYFLGSRSIPWVVACFSIVATETSTLTFISIPGVAYISGMGFIQMALGYIIGRFLVAYILLPRYFEGNFDTVYEFLQNKFSINSRRIIAVLFQVTRVLADSIRLFATAIPLALLTGMDYRLAVLLIGVATFLYTYVGGIKSVATVDSIQLVLYLLCAIIGISIIPEMFQMLPVSFTGVFDRMDPRNLKLFFTGLETNSKGIFGSYNLFSGIIGGAVLCFATHGTDHLMVQRVLSCKNLRSAKKAMIVSGLVVTVQFALFLLFGLFIKELYAGRTFGKPDEILPFFIVNSLPIGLKGLMLAGIFAAAMSSLSSSINSLSASTTMDILRLSDKKMPDERKMVWSRYIAIGWTVVLIGVAMLLNDTKSPLVELGLAVTGLTFGGVLGIFMQGVVFKKFNEKAALISVCLSIGVVIIAWTNKIFWPWYAPIGFVTAFVSGLLLRKLFVFIERAKLAMKM